MAAVTRRPRWLLGAALGVLAAAAWAGAAAAQTRSSYALQVERALEHYLRPGHTAQDEASAFALARSARASQVLPDASRILFDTTRYYAVVGRFGGPLRAPFLHEMALGRPRFVDPWENAATDDRVRRVGRGHGMPYDCIVVPGYTPADARPADPIHPTAVDRCRRAAADFAARKAPFVIVSGGNVRPDGTPRNEALLLKAEMVRQGVPADRILVEGYARHSTTNLRNAGRFMMERGFGRALIVTSADQSFYFSWPWISTFHFRCMADLGYRLGSLRFVDFHRTRFVPADECRRERHADPLDY